jgi:DNA-binding YbaB/EbfC family protein
MKIPGMGGMMKQIQDMQNNMKKMQDELEAMEVEGTAGAGMVSVTITGKNDCRKVNISDDAYDDKEMLEDLIAAAFNDAVRKVEKMKEEKMGSITGGLNIPGMDQFLK